jgi:hypothetical protein
MATETLTRQERAKALGAAGCPQRSAKQFRSLVWLFGGDPISTYCNRFAREGLSFCYVGDNERMEITTRETRHSSDDPD